MKKIFRHIEYLLLEHDYVIIPQLGGFVANKMPSVWSAEEELLLPPYRTVHFNASLNHGDTTLVDSLAASYSVTHAEAEKWCAQFVQGIHMELLENGMLDFGSIGVMIQESPEQPITFSPCKAGVTTPSLYGLDAFHMPLLAQAGSVTETPAHVSDTENTPKQEKTRNYTLQINRHLAHGIAAMAASIILFVLFATPISSPVQHISSTNKAELFIPTHLLNSLDANSAADIVAEPAEIESMAEVFVKEEPLVKEIEAPAQTEVKVETKAEVKAEKPKATKAVKVQETPAQEKQKGMAIVLASVISVSNAEAYASQLQARGYDAHVYQKGKMTRVIIPCYDGEQVTRHKLKQMKQSCSEFEQAWVTALE